MKEKIQRINDLLLTISVRGNDVAALYEAQILLKNLFAEIVANEKNG